LVRAVSYSTYSSAKSAGLYAGIHQGHMQVGFQNQASVAQPMNPFQQVNRPQVMANMPIAGDRGPQRYAEGYQ
jgi:hypothetical protein